MKATGIRMTRIQKETVLEKLPQLTGFFGDFGELGIGINRKVISC
jgi:hypothetical protein